MEPVAELPKSILASKILLHLFLCHGAFRKSFRLQRSCGMDFYICQDRQHSATGSMALSGDQRGPTALLKIDGFAAACWFPPTPHLHLLLSPTA
jgi:hypothetical protein